jgi:hypothetical protein
MSEAEIIDLWNMFREYIDKKQLGIAAERYVDLLADYGVTDQALTDALGHDAVLDSAIHYYLEIEEPDIEDDY